MGSNLGDSPTILRRAAAALRDRLRDGAIAPLYRTAPLSPRSQPDFLNTVVTGTTGDSPRELLAFAQRLEHLAGRQPGPRWGPRRLDVDLLLYGNRVLAEPDLVIPHPEMRHRRFVLAPLADLAPDLAVPPDDTTVAKLLAALGEEQRVERIDWAGPSP